MSVAMASISCRRPPSAIRVSFCRIFAAQSIFPVPHVSASCSISRHFSYSIPEAVPFAAASSRVGRGLFSQARHQFVSISVFCFALVAIHFVSCVAPGSVLLVRGQLKEGYNPYKFGFLSLDDPILAQQIGDVFIPADMVSPSCFIALFSLLLLLPVFFLVAFSSTWSNPCWQSPRS